MWQFQHLQFIYSNWPNTFGGYLPTKEIWGCFSSLRISSHMLRAYVESSGIRTVSPSQALLGTAWPSPTFWAPLQPRTQHSGLKTLTKPALLPSGILHKCREYLVSKRLMFGIPGWRSGLVPAFGPGRDPGDLGSNPTSGSRCMEPASPSACVSAPLSLSLSLSLCDYHK